jgi:hypothetical protein
VAPLLEPGFDSIEALDFYLVGGYRVPGIARQIEKVMRAPSIIIIAAISHG